MDPIYRTGDATQIYINVLKRKLNTKIVCFPAQTQAQPNIFEVLACLGQSDK